MSSRNPGIAFEVIDGVHKGKMAIARHAKQRKEFQQIKRLYVEFYEPDWKPVLLDGKKVVGLIQAAFLKQIGMVD